MKQDRAALEDRDVSIREPRHLAEGLVREMLGIPSAKWHALDAIGQPGLFQRPTHTYVTHIAARLLGNPIEGGEDQVGHSASPSVDPIYNRLRAPQKVLLPTLGRKRLLAVRLIESRPLVAVPVVEVGDVGMRMSERPVGVRMGVVGVRG